MAPFGSPENPASKRQNMKTRVQLADRKVRVKRPRLRHKTEGEVPVPAGAGRGPLRLRYGVFLAWDLSPEELAFVARRRSGRPHAQPGLENHDQAGRSRAVCRIEGIRILECRITYRRILPIAQTLRFGALGLLHRRGIRVCLSRAGRGQGQRNRYY
jgi:hypothetical protein